MRDLQVRQQMVTLVYHGIHQDCQYYLKIRINGIITTAGTAGAAQMIFLFAPLMHQLLMNVKYLGVIDKHQFEKQVHQIINVLLAVVEVMIQDLQEIHRELMASNLSMKEALTL